MYGASKTKISRKDVMELHGVMDYFDCDRAFFFYNGKISSDALKAAEKLRVEWIYVDYLEMDSPLTTDYTNDAISIDEIWDKYIKPLEGKELINTQGFSNKILKVDDAYIVRLSHTGKLSKVKKDWFKWIIDRVLHYGYAEAVDLRNEFHCRESSFVTLVFREIPLFKVTYNPRTIKFANQ